MRALDAWPAVPAEVAGAVREAMRFEPDDELRERMKEFLRKAQ